MIDNRVANQHVRSQHFDQQALIGLVIREEEIRVKQVAEKGDLVSCVHNVDLLKTINGRQHCS